MRFAVYALSFVGRGGVCVSEARVDGAARVFSLVEEVAARKQSHGGSRGVVSTAGLIARLGATRRRE